MIEYLSVEEVIAMHDAFLKEFGGLQGIRDMNLLISAVETPKARMFGKDLHPTIYDKASAYLYHIVCNILSAMEIKEQDLGLLYYF